jgi:adenine-specific DNA-methyltransferase
MAQAMLELNREDDGNRRFVMVQLPEPTGAAEFPTISDIGKERIRRVIARMEAEDAGKLTTGRETPEDLGFRVFKLGRSNYKAWRDFDGEDLDGLQTLFDRFESPLVEGWQPEDVLTEVMLIEGFPLDSTVETLPEFAHNTVTRVTSDLLAHRLFVCLDAAVHDETIAALVMGKDDSFICLDAALSDEAKVRLEDGRRVKVI